MLRREAIQKGFVLAGGKNDLLERDDPNVKYRKPRTKYGIFLRNVGNPDLLKNYIITLKSINTFPLTDARETIEEELSSSNK